MLKRLLAICAAAGAAVLLTTGCGSPAEEEAASAPSSTRQETHAAEAGEPELPDVPGYTYSDLAGIEQADLNAMRAQMDAANAQAPGSLLSIAGHYVTGPSGEDLMVIELQVGAELARDPEVMQAFTASLLTGMASEGMAVQLGEMAGVEVVQGVDSHGWAGCGWSQGDLLFMVFGYDEDSVNSYSAAVIKTSIAS